MIPTICGVSAMLSCRPFFRNHAIKNMSSSQFLLVNSTIITILILLYIAFYEDEERENFATFSDLEGTQYMAILLFSIFTVISSIVIVDLQKDEVIVSNFLLTTITSIFLFLIGYMMFNESINIKQFLGIALVVVGLFIVTQFKDDTDKHVKG